MMDKNYVQPRRGNLIVFRKSRQYGGEATRCLAPMPRGTGRPLAVALAHCNGASVEVLGTGR